MSFQCILCESTFASLRGGKAHIRQFHPELEVGASGRGAYLRRVDSDDDSDEYLSPLQHSSPPGGSQGSVVVSDVEDVPANAAVADHSAVAEEPATAVNYAQVPANAAGNKRPDPVSVMASKLGCSEAVFRLIMTGVTHCTSNTKVADQIISQRDANVAEYTGSLCTGNRSQVAEKLKDIKGKMRTIYRQCVTDMPANAARISSFERLPSVHPFTSAEVLLPKATVTFGRKVREEQKVMFRRPIREVAVSMMHEVISKLGREHVHLIPEIQSRPIWGPGSKRVRVLGGPWTAVWWQVLHKYFARQCGNAGHRVGLLPLVLFLDKAASGLYPAMLTCSSFSLEALDSFARRVVGLLPVAKIAEHEKGHENSSRRVRDLMQHCWENLLSDVIANEEVYEKGW
jgi:hypothetical protein